MGRRGSPAGWLLLIAALCACAGEPSDDGGGAGTMMAPLTIGSPCTDACPDGTVCARSGVFAGQCATTCSGMNSCGALAISVGKPLSCFGMGEMKCGITCTDNTPCPQGTVCAAVGGQMGCTLPP